MLLNPWFSCSSISYYLIKKENKQVLVVKMKDKIIIEFVKQIIESDQENVLTN